MKLFGQHGYGDGQKLRQGLDLGYIDGAIFSPKDIGRERLRGILDELAQSAPNAERLFDPQYYATLVAAATNSRCGSLITDYAAYFGIRRRAQLESETRVRDDLRDTMRFTRELNLTSVITPSVVIPRSLNSIEAVVAKNFIRHAKDIGREVGDTRPLLATLAIGVEALRRHEELIEFLSDITVMDDRPDGFYLLAATPSADGRIDIFNSDTIAGWLFLNHALSLNGFRVVNGYSDILTPFLGAAGASAGATGWWSNLRSFSLNRFAPESTGGRLPVPRYLSCSLLNRITFDELERLRDAVPEVLNGLDTDELYPVERGSEPERSQEVLQSWDAIRELNRRMVVESDVTESLAQCTTRVDEAAALYNEVQAALFATLDPRSDSGHLEPLRDGLAKFAELAELRAPEE